MLNNKMDFYLKCKLKFSTEDMKNLNIFIRLERKETNHPISENVLSNT